MFRFHSDPLVPSCFVYVLQGTRVQQVQRIMIRLHNQGPLLCKQALRFIVSAFSS